ncbi:hypothetical protein FOB64_001273 [Candida albicans]|uniref:Uncharacterized protein n=1 Tax=Candida albicans TaxID=5476 RepID=A0A8H6C4W5_CANAX|nr:hypothetical protein FOB64_001273 [Candida albicans]
MVYITCILGIGEDISGDRRYDVMDGAIGRKDGGTRATAGTVYPISGYGCAGCQRLYHSLVPTYIPGTGLSPPLARKSGSAGTRAGAEIKLGPEPEPEPEPGSGPGSMADVPKLKGNGQSQSRV